MTPISTEMLQHYERQLEWELNNYSNLKMLPQSIHRDRLLEISTGFIDSLRDAIDNIKSKQQ